MFRRVCGDDARLGGGAWSLACFVRHIPRARFPPQKRGGSRGSETCHLISAFSRLKNIEPPRWLRTRTHPLALFPIAFFCQRHNPRPDRDHARVRQEFVLRYTAPVAPSIHGTWHKPPPRFSQRPPTALCPTLLSDRCEPPTTTPCVPPLIAPRCASSHAPVSLPRDAPTGRSADPCGPQRAGVHVCAQGQGLLVFVVAA